MKIENDVIIIGRKEYILHIMYNEMEIIHMILDRIMN